jgi:hypothetical protein
LLTAVVLRAAIAWSRAHIYNDDAASAFMWQLLLLLLLLLR